MTAVSDAPRVAPTPTLGQQVVRILTTTDHKLIGKMYLVTSFGFFIIGFPPPVFAGRGPP